jgi:hypothetical protein
VIKDMKTQKLIIIAIIALLFVGGGIYFLRVKSPKQKVEDLKIDVVKQQESSGYNECLKQIEEQETQLKKCSTDKLVAKGYTDGIDCIQDYTNPVCKETARYNAEVDADNECGAAPTTSPRLTQIDCMKLLEKK